MSSGFKIKCDVDAYQCRYMSDLENRVRSLEHAFGDLQTTRSLSQAGSSPAASGPMLTATSQTGGNVSMADELFLITAPSQIFFGMVTVEN